MNIWDIVIAAIIIAACAAALVHMVRSRGKSCSCGCAGCGKECAAAIRSGSTPDSAKNKE